MRLQLAFLLVVPIWIFATIWLASSGECGAGASCMATGPLGAYLLVSFQDASAWELTCPYFAPTDALRPTVCSRPAS